MFATEDLNLLWLEISPGSATLLELRDCLESVWRCPAYQAWLKGGSLRAFDRLAALDAPGRRWLEHRGIACDGRLLIKVNRIGERLFLTDGAWVSHLMRVFPDPDEATLLIDFAEKRGLHAWAELVIDPAAGCGHTPIGIGGRARRIACDANARAVLYARLNARLNGLSSDAFTAVLNDLNEGVPPSLCPASKTLFLANVPFAPAPGRGALALNSAGGSTGSDLQLASFRMMKTYHETHRQPARGCFLTWTVGSLERDVWEVPARCREVFPHGRVRWTLVHHEYDAPELPNPAPLAATLRYLSASQYAVKAGDSATMLEFERLAAELLDRGLTHVAYGMLEVELD